MSTEIITYSGTVKALKRGTQAGILETCINVTRDAAAYAPVITGRLKNSIMYKCALGSSSANGEKEIEVSPKEMEGYVGSGVVYSIYKEFGTRYLAPKPFLRPAIALVFGADKDDIERKIAEETARGPLKEGRKVETFK